MKELILIGTSFAGFIKPTSKIIYVETNQRVCKLLKILNIILVKITPIGVTLTTIVSLLTYLSTDLGVDSLKLPLPMWWD